MRYIKNYSGTIRKKGWTIVRNTRIVLFLLTILLPIAVWGEEAPLRVACVGNSVTYGYGLKNPAAESYPTRLQEMLGSNYQVGNFGHSGSTLLSRGHRPYVKTPEYRAAIDFKADWVVIHLGLNDTDPRNWPDWKEEFIPNYRALIDSFRVANPKARVLICQMTPIFDRHPRFQSGTRDWHAQIQQAIRAVALGADVQLIDLWTPLHSRPDLFGDALHPNADGARILARTVYGALTGNYGGLKLPLLYGDDMVLQRECPVRLHGTANTGELVSVSLSKEKSTVATATATAGTDGQWKVELPAMKAGGPYTLSFTTTKPAGKRGKTVICAEKVLHNVLFGDVWLASGQSNMELRVDQVLSEAQDVADAARLTNVRLFNMPARFRTDAVEWPDSALLLTNELLHMDPQGWSKATPEAVRRFSAVAYNFARTLSDSLTDVPIGIISNAVGGSTTESWIDRSTLEWQMPNILSNWLYADYGQAWARGRAAQNIAHAIRKDSPVYNPLQRHPYDPCYLFEAAIRPLEQPQIKGVIWYQGESNAHNVELHERLFTLLEQSWRQEFSDPSLPFYFVQLSSLPRPSWPAFRDSQRRLAAMLPHTWMAVTTDVGDAGDVHYRNKRPVGERLARQALVHTYGRKGLVPEGPVLRHGRVAADGRSVVLTFANARGLSVSRGFEVAGADGLFRSAKPQVQADGTVLLTISEGAKPCWVRYGWSGFTDADLRNSDGLPASTFLSPLFTE